jgi:hypothetical protein
MTRRAPFVLAGILLIAAGALTGCQAAGSFTRANAQADAATWTKSVVAASGSPASAATTKFNGFEACRTDRGFFTTTSQWRTVTDIAMPLSHQPASTTAIARSFVASGWKESRPRGLVTLKGGGGQRRGLITVQTAGPTGLAITVESGCYA